MLKVGQNRRCEFFVLSISQRHEVPVHVGVINVVV